MQKRGRDGTGQFKDFLWLSSIVIILRISAMQFAGPDAITSALESDREDITMKAITNGSYINFPYNCLRNYEKEYYGGNARKLRQINEEYDPRNVFNFPQGIREN